MKASTNYKTAFGLYRATMRALETLDGCKRGWWIQNAIQHAEASSGLNDPGLAKQLRDLVGAAAPQVVAQLQPRG